MENEKMIEPERESEVEGEICRLSDEIETLSNRIGKLEKTLGNVLRKPGEEKLKAATTERRVLVPIAAQIRDRGEQVADLSYRVNDIINRLGN